MTPEDFHNIAVPLFAAVALTLLAMGACAAAMIRQGRREKARRREDAEPS